MLRRSARASRRAMREAVRFTLQARTEPLRRTDPARLRSRRDSERARHRLRARRPDPPLVMLVSSKARRTRRICPALREHGQGRHDYRNRPGPDAEAWAHAVTDRNRRRAESRDLQDFDRALRLAPEVGSGPPLSPATPSEKAKWSCPAQDVAPAGQIRPARASARQTPNRRVGAILTQGNACCRASSSLQATSPECAEYPREAIAGEFWHTTLTQSLGSELLEACRSTAGRAIPCGRRKASQARTVASLARARDFIHWDLPDGARLPCPLPEQSEDLHLEDPQRRCGNRASINSARRATTIQNRTIRPRL